MAANSDALLASLIAARNGVSKPAQRDWTTLVFVSLYLVLLAFFLALNSVSTKEGDKVRSAMESIDARFRGPFYEESGVIDIKQRSGVVRTSNDALDDIGVLLRGIALAPGLKGQADGDTLRVSVLTHTLFPPRGNALRENQSGVFETLAEILQRGDSDAVDTSFVVGTGDALPRPGTPAADLAARRAAALSAALTSRGVAPSTVAAGVGTEDAVTTVLTFKRRRPVVPVPRSK
jgi:outer membrane protein OmpA-like peptidoglycan-associated protein